MNLFSNIFRGLGLTSVALLLALTLVAAVPIQAPQQDTAGNGLTDNAEEICKTARTQIDSDGDGLSDWDELCTYQTDPENRDTDSDGLTDWEEVNTHNTNPLDEDSDGDGLTDKVEITENSSNPLWADTDGDGLTDGEELNTHGTDPRKRDTDGDDLSDADEVKQHQTDPNNRDTDDDGLSDGDEINKHKTDPNLADTDEDGLSDSDEINKHKTDPNLADTDEDGLSDGDEVKKYFTYPLKKDTDGDTLSDGDEVNLYGTHPKKGDTDGDGFTDDHNVETPGPTSDPTAGTSETVPQATPAPETPEIAETPKPNSPKLTDTEAILVAGYTETKIPPANQQELVTTPGPGVTTEPEKQGLFGFFSPDRLWDWLLIAVVGVIAFSILAALVTLIRWWWSKRGGLQEQPPDPSAQRAVQRRKETKATELRNLSAILGQQAQELRELSFLEAVLANPPSVNGDMSALLDREQVVLSAVQTLEGLAGPTANGGLPWVNLLSPWKGRD